MNAVKPFDGLIIEEFLGLFINWFESIIQDFLDNIKSLLDIFINLLDIYVPREELNDGVQLEDQVAYFFDFTCWFFKELNVFLKANQSLGDFLFNVLSHLIVDKFYCFFKLQLLWELFEFLIRI